MTETEVAPVESFCTNEVEKRRNQWHCNRRKEMLAKYPQIKELMTTNPVTALALVTLLTAHIAVAYVSAYYLPLWAALLILYFFNATVVHSAGILCHEITHNLAFKTPLYNKLLLLMTSCFMIFRPLTFRLDHLVHHSYLEDLETNPEYGGEALFNSPWYTVTQKMWHKIMVSIPILLPIDMIIYRFFYMKYEDNAQNRVNNSQGTLEQATRLGWHSVFMVFTPTLPSDSISLDGKRSSSNFWENPCLPLLAISLLVQDTQVNTEQSKRVNPLTPCTAGKTTSHGT